MDWPGCRAAPDALAPLVDAAPPARRGGCRGRTRIARRAPGSRARRLGPPDHAHEHALPSRAARSPRELIRVLIEQCTVSRKTPLDGKLEISASAAERLGSLGD